VFDNQKAASAAAGRLTRWLAGCAALAMVPAAPAFASGTQAGTKIVNTATATYEVPDSDVPVEVDSNEVELTVDELLDVVVDWADTANVQVYSPSSTRVLQFTVTNSGNGTERYALTYDAAVAGDSFDPSVTKIVIDNNKNGAYDPLTDTDYVPGVSTNPELDADEQISVLVISSIPASQAAGAIGRVQLVATAATGTGTPGQVVGVSQGQGGGNAVVGANGGNDDDTGGYVVIATPVNPNPDPTSMELVKSAVVLDPFGGTTVVPGSIITYKLVAEVSGDGDLENIVISDTIPAGSTYEDGTITLGTAGLTDANDGDVGKFDTGAKKVTVDVGTMSGGTTKTVTFKVKVDSETP